MIILCSFCCYVLIAMFLSKGCYSVIKKELIKERIQFDTVVDYLLTEWFKVVLAMVGTFVVLKELCHLLYNHSMSNNSMYNKTDKKRLHIGNYLTYWTAADNWAKHIHTQTQQKHNNYCNFTGNIKHRACANLLRISFMECY